MKTNRYPEQMDGLERVLKNLRWHAARLRSWLRHGRVCYVVTAPDFPSKRASIQAFAQALGWVVTNVDRHDDNGTKAVLRLAFHDTTCAEPRKEGWVNGARGDISKSALEARHHSVFNYGVAVDPLTYKGVMLEKSEANAAHDGSEIKGPITAVTSGKVYQRIIDNRLPDDRFADFRAVVIGDALPMVYCKVKAAGRRYTNETAEVTLLETEAVFSSQECDQILALCRLMGVDFAELDVLRDAGDGLVYVVDVNPTPYGPPAGLSKSARARAVAQGSEALQRLTPA